MTDQTRFGARLPMTIGITAMILLVGGVGMWSISTKVSGAVIANGMVVVERNRQIVQHAEGGVVGEIHARDGDQIEADDLLVRLDDTLLRSELTIMRAKIIELGARGARLRAERDGQATIKIAQDIIDLAGTDPEARAQINGQKNLFHARKKTLEEERKQIEERIAQAKNQITGASAQLQALITQETLLSEELANFETLLAKRLIQAQRVTNLRRDVVGVSGDIGKVQADIARLNGQVAELEIDKLRLATSRREQAIVTLRDIQFRALELKEQYRKTSARLSRLDIRAPVAGTVYNSSVFAENAVIQPADPMMYVIPRDQLLIISTRVEAIHVDQIHVGQPAFLRFTAFNQRQTPEIEGKVILVSADVFQDETTRANYYRVDLVPIEQSLNAVADLQLLPGMPVEAYLKTEDRTPLSFLTKPLTDYFSRALREG